MQVKVPSVLDVVRLLEFAAFFTTISSAVSAVGHATAFPTWYASSVPEPYAVLLMAKRISLAASSAV
jgi:hypothetical protein